MRAPRPHHSGQETARLASELFAAQTQGRQTGGESWLPSRACCTKTSWSWTLESERVSTYVPTPAHFLIDRFCLKR